MDKTNQNPESCLYVSEDVIAKVIANAAASVDGVVSITGSRANPLRLLLDKRNHGKMKIKLEGDVLSVAVSIVLKSNAAGLETAERVQESIKSAVQNILGITVAKVNVNISDIVFE
jgi:uncharacterized alkaline shock family protein YloU